jgi:glucose-1-phosphate adenylyltransferase
MMNHTLTVILAGGKGTRLEPLTRDRAKPAVPFGGSYRIIDFVLSNCLNSGLRKLLVLTQYKAMSLDRHVNLGWRQYFVRELGEYIDIVPPQQRIDEQWYQGTADAVYQNIYAIEKENPKYVLILAGDHIYKMNYRAMIEYHEQQGADLTIGALRVPREDATQFGVMQIESDQRVVGFQEKPQEPQTIPGDDQHCLASMGIYVFSTRFLFEKLCLDATLPTSHHDFGKNIIPSIIGDHRVFAFPFRDENRKRDAYWRDVGTLDAYYEANMDLIATDPLLNLYDVDWPIRTLQPNLPPPKFVFGSRNDSARCGQALDSIVCSGSIISGGRVERSILGASTRIHSYALVEDSILFDGVDIGRGTKIRRAIIDKRVRIPAGMEIGYDLDLDRERGFTVSPSGVVVLSKTDSLRMGEPTSAAHMYRLDPASQQPLHQNARHSTDSNGKRESLGLEDERC